MRRIRPTVPCDSGWSTTRKTRGPADSHVNSWVLHHSIVNIFKISLQALRLNENFKECLKRYGDEEIPAKEIVAELMTDRVKADLNRLPVTGCDPDWEFVLSSIFVESKKGRYGTRSMAALSVTSNGEVNFYERCLDASAGVWKEHTVKYQMENLK